MSALNNIKHRPYPLETGPWVMGQRWHDLLFAHWRVDPDAIQALLPPPLEVDTRDGDAWLGVIPFAMTDVRIRGLPGNTRLSSFLELNVRTYARHGDRAGVFFFSLDASSRMAVAAARRWFHLPYFNARMDLQRRGEQILYRSQRTHRDAANAELAIAYSPTGPPVVSESGSLEEWLVERYRLLVARRDGRIMTGEIHHSPWLLQNAAYEIHRNTMPDWLGFPLDRAPDHVRFARFQDVLIWRPRIAVGDTLGHR